MTTLGEFLRNTRISKNLTLGQVKKATHIREHVLISIEENELEIFHSPAQLRGFIKHYSEFLGLDPVTVISEYLNTNAGTTSPISDELSQAAPLSDDDGAPYQTLAAAETEKTNETLATTVENPAATIPSSSSDQRSYKAIFYAIAAALVERRQLLKLSVDEVEYYSHLRRRTIELLERGDFDAFTSSVQVKGLLATYADFLELDREQILAEFAEGLMTRRRELAPADAIAIEPAKIANAAQPFPMPLRLRSLASVDLVFGFSVIAILAAIGLWGAYTIINTNQAVPTQNASLSQALIANSTPLANIDATASAEATSAGVSEQQGGAVAVGADTQVTETVAPLPTTLNSMPINVTLVITDKLFLRVTVDGKTVLTTRTNPGQVLDYHGEKSIEILTGNGAGIKVVYNNDDMGAMGEAGEAVLQIYNAAGAITPTPTISPTPTPTGRPTRTPIPTATPRASATPGQ